MNLFSLQERKQGQSHCKFNNSLLHDNTFVTKMKENIPEFYNESAKLNDILSKWEFLKKKAVERISSRLYLEKRRRA